MISHLVDVKLDVHAVNVSSIGVSYRGRPPRQRSLSLHDNGFTTMIRRLKFVLATVIGTVCVSGSTGCNTTINEIKTGQPFYHDWPLVGRDKDDGPIPYPNPVKMATTWSPDTLVQHGRTPTRGFGGRIYFYDQKSNAVPVDGKLIVHGFDDTAGNQSDAANVKRYEFTPEQFTRHFSQSDLGASYSIWIPWDAVGGPQRRISLVASFETVGGKFVQGEPATILLPGANNESVAQTEEKLFSREYHRYRDALAAGGSSQGMTTTTIARGKSQRPGQRDEPEALVAGTRTGQLRTGTLTPNDFSPNQWSPNRAPGGSLDVRPATMRLKSSKANRLTPPR